MNIYALSTLSAGVDILDILKRRISIKGIIGLSRITNPKLISGYVCMEAFCTENAIDFIPVETYSLKNKNDQMRLMSLDIDILIVCGWQRLIPNWLIEHCKVCAIGAHGSAYGITGGRGRSPQNWALILGEKEFYISIFRIDASIDSGGVIDTRSFPLTRYDDIRTSYCKACWLIAEMIAENLENGKILAGRTTPQSGSPKYLPQRLPEDGEIDWRRSAEEIYNFVRALTRPYPGAYSKFDGYKIIIWKGRPLYLPDTNAKFQVGEILQICHDGGLLIKTGDGTLFVDDYTLEPDVGKSFLKEGLILTSCDFKAQIKRIIDRHYENYPDLEISEEVMKLIN